VATVLASRVLGAEGPVGVTRGRRPDPRASRGRTVTTGVSRAPSGVSLRRPDSSHTSADPQYRPQPFPVESRELWTWKANCPGAQSFPRHPAPAYTADWSEHL